MRQREFAPIGPHGPHRVAWTEWGDPDNPRVVMCVHGLTRNGRDFDVLARELCGRYRVVCPDVAGRGRSQWLEHPLDYGYPLYLSDMRALVEELGAARVDWVGTSMGGLIGMLMAATPGNPIARLVMNDVGPFIPRAALERIADYVGRDPRFRSLAEAEACLRQVHAPFGPLSDDDWRHMAQHGTRVAPDGLLALGYDPAIAQAFGGPLADVDLWPAWDALTCPVLVLRGAESDLLDGTTTVRMRDTDPARVSVVTFPGVGHAPALTTPDQVAAVSAFLA